MIEPFPYQKAGLEAMERFSGRVLLAYEMGLGKTLMALWFIQRSADSRLPAVVVCPASVKYQWEREVRRVFGFQASVAEGTKPPRRLSGDLLIVNYDVLRHWVDRIAALKPKTVVLDECQYAMNPRAKRTRAVQAVCKKVPHVLALSGTPLLNRPIELFPTVNILRPDVFQRRLAFAWRYCGPHWTPWGWKYDRTSNAEELHERLKATCMIRQRKADVLSELPEKVRSVVPLPLSDPSEYRRASTDFLAWLARQDPAAAARAGRAVALTRVGYLLRLCAKLKLRSVVDWVNDWLSRSDGEKMVLFAVHRKAIEALARQCEGGSVIIDGDTPGRSRTLLVERFERDPKIRLLIGNIRAAGVGLNLQKAARTVAFAEMAWRPADHTQAEDRCHRIGTRDTVWCYYLVSRGTIEERLCALIQEKQEVLSTVLDGGLADGDLDVFDQLLAELRKDARRA